MVWLLYPGASPSAAADFGAVVGSSKVKRLFLWSLVVVVVVVGVGTTDGTSAMLDMDQLVRYVVFGW